MTSPGGWIEKTESTDAVELRATGDWRVDGLDAIARQIEKVMPRAATDGGTRGDAGPGGETMRVDAGGITAIDSSGAWLLFKVTRIAEERGFAPELRGLDENFENLIERARRAAEHAREQPKAPRSHPVLRGLDTLGEGVFNIAGKAKEMVNFLGMIVLSMLGSFTHPRRIHLRAVAKHIETTGLNALPIVGLLSFLIGVVIAFMGAVQLQKFGADIYTVDLVGVAVLRELGVLFAAIMVAGRSGSAFTAQIGTMKVNQEIDAMQTIGLNPVDVLVLPRITALIIALPLLTIYADLVGIAGGAVICAFVLDISTTAFLNELATAIDVETFLIGMVKAPIFAFVIGLVGCFEGLKVTGSAQSVGERTTTSVVEGIFLVIAIDAAFAMALSYLGI